jgi:hypothetical protein
MNHPSEEDLILHYYGEADESLETGRHLDGCEECRALYSSLQRLLNTVDGLPVPARDDDYDAWVWGRLDSRLPRQRWNWTGAGPAWRWAMAGVATLVLLATGFVAGRYYPRPGGPVEVASDGQARERVLLVAVGDCLERSQMVLIELVNASAEGPLDISSEQARAEELVSETRLYRQTAATTGNTSVAELLDELERVLLDVAHSPSSLSPAQVETLRTRLDAEGIIFKIRVVNSNVRSRQELPAPGIPRQKL